VVSSLLDSLEADILSAANARVDESFSLARALLTNPTPREVLVEVDNHDQQNLLEEYASAFREYLRERFRLRKLKREYAGGAYASQAAVHYYRALDEAKILKTRKNELRQACTKQGLYTAIIRINNRISKEVFPYSGTGPHELSTSKLVV
jgi:hypothetical protein